MSRKSPVGIIEQVTSTWTPARFLRLALWLVVAATTLTGLSLLLNRTVTLWSPLPDTEYTSEATVIDVTGIGLALLCTGVVSLVLGLIAELVLVRLPAPHARRAPSGDIQG